MACEEEGSPRESPKNPTSPANKQKEVAPTSRLTIWTVRVFEWKSGWKGRRWTSGH